MPESRTAGRRRQNLRKVQPVCVCIGTELCEKIRTLQPFSDSTRESNGKARTYDTTEKEENPNLNEKGVHLRQRGEVKTSNVRRTNGTGKHEGPPAAYAAAAAGAVSPRPGSALSSSSANPVCTSTDKDCFAVRSTCERTSNPGKTPPEKCRSCRNHRSKLAGCGRTRRRPQAENRLASNRSENWNHTRTLSCAHTFHQRIIDFSV